MSLKLDIKYNIVQNWNVCFNKTRMITDILHENEADFWG